MNSMVTAALAVLALLVGAASPSALEAGQAPEGMVLVPAGKFFMGTDDSELSTLLKNTRAKAVWFRDETPKREKEVKAYYIDSHEVTNAGFQGFRKDHSYPMGRENHPVVGVTWNEADAFCRFVGKRLPTEEEWEKAARGDDGRVYPWGNTYEKTLANTSEAGFGGRAKVGEYRIEQSGEKLPAGTTGVGTYPGGKSPYGVYDMAGNVWEWTDSWYDTGKMLRVLRGGSWLAPALSARTALRLGETPSTVANDYGFRCAKDAE